MIKQWSVYCNVMLESDFYTSEYHKWYGYLDITFAHSWWIHVIKNFLDNLPDCNVVLGSIWIISGYPIRYRYSGYQFAHGW